MFRGVKAIDICIFHNTARAVILLDVAIVLYPASKITYLCAMNVDIKISGVPGVFYFFVVKSADI